MGGKKLVFLSPVKSYRKSFPVPFKYSQPVFRKQRGFSPGFVLPLVLVTLGIIAALAFTLHYLWRHEASIAHRLKFSEMTVKAAEGAAAEAMLWFKINLELVPEKKADPFVMALFTEKDLVGIEKNFDCTELNIFEAASEAGVTVEEVRLYYEDFFPFFENEKGHDPAINPVISSDPFERYGSLVAEVRARTMDVRKKYCMRRELKIVNTSPSILSKFTLYVREKRGSVNGVKCHSRKNYAMQGIISLDSDSNGLAPLVLINHPEDMRTVNGPVSSYSELFDMSEPETNVPLAKKGWVFLGPKTGEWILNVTPGHPNPDVTRNGYPPSLAPRFYGEGFSLREAFIRARISKDDPKSLHRYYPFNLEACSRLNVTRQLSKIHGINLPPELISPPSSLEEQKKHSPGILRNHIAIDGMILEFWNLGISWIINPEKPDILENYFRHHPGESTSSSLLALMGDIQPLSFEGSEVTKYLDRRSPTLVFGPVIRRYLRVGIIYPFLRNDEEPPSKDPLIVKSTETPVRKKFLTGELPYFGLENNEDASVLDYFKWDSDWAKRRIVKDIVYEKGKLKIRVVPKN